MTSLQPTGAAVMNEAQLKLMQELELEVMADLFNKMTFSCHEKCVPTGKYRDGELSKGESVCLDRCVAKYMELHEQLGRKLTSITSQQQQQQQQASPPVLPGQLPSQS